METISNVVNTATKAIWGEQATNTTTANETGGNEPVSGLQGKGTVDEPYDQGNASNPASPVAKADLANTNTAKEDHSLDVSKPSTTNTIEPSSTIKPRTAELPIRTAKAPQIESTHEPTSFTNINSAKAEEPSASQHPVDLTTSGPTTSPGVGESNPLSKVQIPTNPTASAAVGESKPLENTEDTGVTGASAQEYAPKGSDVVPSNASKNTSAAPSNAHPETQQGSDRPHDAPSDEATEALKARKDNAEALTKKQDPNNHSDEPMQMHNIPEKDAATQEERRDSKVGNPGSQEHGTEPKETGEKHIKTTGLAADGGDFDASKPGAGREADRLLEQKGMQRDGKGSMEGGRSTSGGSQDHEKVSKLNKLKEKLHIGHKDK